MSNEVLGIIALLSIIIWIAVSKEAVKPTKEIQWPKMLTLLSAGTASAFVITLSLFQSQPF
ncbi:hypothetical protein QL992_02390 [Microbacterium sp. APC 3898]|uniref:Uncharacterized protein n=1 Tax=Planococcus notacanthi TaxID=3035188 RepID=A0ABT7ZGT6_9BACL|nr:MULTISPECIES: hypothetical protein [Terrabacteria group]MDN3426349.1 hypothetical protein [Planococcus sp. APC 4016]MDN3498045.1 hypothetical protein [Microbacterium sp. APC 3898]